MFTALQPTRFMRLAAGAWLLVATEAATAAADGLTDNAQAIHQEVHFAASCARLYSALTDTEQFNTVTLSTDGRQLLAAPGAQPTLINPEPGGAFTLFGGYITGRNLEMQPGRLLVQAWRTGGWAPGEYSVVRMALTQESSGCGLVFDHRGFPSGEGVHLARGWYLHYWDPLRKLLDGA
ncbi:MAG TPA: SRPBCC domain-containing protein [Steroidobacteraceae bacterium]|jgi:activator of HSP90 ATPase